MGGETFAAGRVTALKISECGAGKGPAAGFLP